MGLENIFHNRKIIITGARGFIGSHLCRKLSEYNVELHGVSHKPAHSHENMIQWWIGSMDDIVFARKVISKVRPDYIFHLSGLVTGHRDLKHLIKIYNSLLTSTVNLLTTVSEIGCEKVVIPGSLEEPDDENPHPGSPYAAAKAACRLYTRLFTNLYSTNVAHPRIFMVYGPGQTGFRKLIPFVIQSLLKNEAPELSSGTRQIDWVYIDDVIDGLMTVAHNNYKSEGFDIGTGKTTSVREIVEKLVTITGSTVKPQFGSLNDRPFERIVAAKPNKLWHPKVSIDEGLVRTVAWYRENIKNLNPSSDLI